MKFNIYKFISYGVLSLFIILSTLQTLLDVRTLFDITLHISFILPMTLSSIIPILGILSIINFINKKTKHKNIFVIKEIRSVFRLLTYLLIFSAFVIWSTLLLVVIGFYFQNVISLSVFSSFFMNRIVFSLIYSMLVVLFFYGLSDINKKRKQIQ